MLCNAGRLRLTEVNPHLMCFLCGGYYVDATTIVECLHSFCRGCLIKYLEHNSICPMCEVQIHKAKPFRNIKPDKALQDIVYKLVPGMYHAEMARRRAFYAKHPDQVGKTRPEERGSGVERMIYAPNESISLSLEYYETDRDQERAERDNQASCIKKRYLLCPALVTIGILKKFLRNKYEVTPAYKVEILHKREPLTDDLSLMDVAYIYTWKRNGPIQFHYRFCEVDHQAEVEEVEVKQVEEVTSSVSPEPIPTSQLVEDQPSTSSESQEESTKVANTPPTPSVQRLPVDEPASPAPTSTPALECNGELIAPSPSTIPTSSTTPGPDEVKQASVDESIQPVPAPSDSTEKTTENNTSTETESIIATATNTAIDATVNKPMNKTPDPMEKIPEPVKKTPDQMKKTPDPLKKTPDPVKNIPDPVKKIPDPVKKIPEPVKKIPDPVKKTPDSVKKTPDSVKKTPEPMSKIPDLMQETPDIMKETPDLMKETPDLTKETPDIMKETSDITKKTSGIMKETPDIMKDTPDIPVKAKTDASDDGKNSLPVIPVKPRSKSPVGEVTDTSRVPERVNTSRISIGLLASLALERRSNSALSVSVARKRAATDGGGKLEAEKRPRIAPKPVPSLTNIIPVTNSTIVSKNTSGRYSAGPEISVTKTPSLASSSSENCTRKENGPYIPDKLSITPVPAPRNEQKANKTCEEQKPGVSSQPKAPPKTPVIETSERPKRPASQMSSQHVISPQTKTVSEQYTTKMSTIPRLIEINPTSVAKTNVKKPRVASKRVGKRADGQKHDGIGALDLSSSTRRPNQQSADILAIAQNLARRHQLLAQASTPTPPLSPLSSMSAFPVPSFVPVRSPPPSLRIPIPPASSSSFRLLHPHQQRPSSLSSSSPSPPAESAPSGSRSARVAPPHEMFTPPAHLLPPPPPPNSTLMFRSRFELQNPWHGEWYNEQLMRCLESLRRGEGLPPAPYFPYAGNSTSNSSKNSSNSSRK